MAADRECDPDLCMQCQWSISGQKPPGSVDCHNMKLRLRQHKRVAMGLSNVAGWGAFAQVPRQERKEKKSKEKESKAKERKGKERKGKERKGKERETKGKGKGKERACCGHRRDSNPYSMDSDDRHNRPFENTNSHADLGVVLWQEDIRRNEFVAEYTGELINHREADRRGKAYDRDSNTYLFDLNDEWVIDAKHRGNKMRFANHRFESNNCACHRDPLNAMSFVLFVACKVVGAKQLSSMQLMKCTYPPLS